MLGLFENSVDSIFVFQKSNGIYYVCFKSHFCLYMEKLYIDFLCFTTYKVQSSAIIKLKISLRDSTVIINQISASL